MESFDINFVRSDGKSVNVRLFSHYTCICGKFSGEGKSEFVSLLEDGISTGDISVVSELPFAIATAGSLDVILNTPDRSIIMVDEAEMLHSRFLSKINQSKHLFITVTRAFPLKLDYPLQGIYKLSRDNDWFVIENVSGLNVSDNCIGCKMVITESHKGRSEHELMSCYLNNVQAAGGRDRIEKLLRNTTGDILVLADLGNIGRAYAILAKRCRDNPSIKFYNYQSFEEFLCASQLVRNLQTTTLKYVFDYITIEKYYKDVLTELTIGSCLEYEHGKNLPKAFLDKSNFDLVFKSDTGRGLYDFINSYNSLVHGGDDKKQKRKHTKEMSAF
ncbi:MAG: hypothetical protein HFH68_01535 [Lachnospiraceae bacterium]|nr:hypothetical protein [Lachnospiraceae bacterium]